MYMKNARRTSGSCHSSQRPLMRLAPGPGGAVQDELSGNVTGGYTSDFGSSTASDHRFTAGHRQPHRLLLRSEISLASASSLLQPVLGELRLSIHSEFQRSHRQFLYIRRQQHAGSSLIRRLSTVRDVRSPRRRQLHQHGDRHFSVTGRTCPVHVSVGYQQAATTIRFSGASSNIVGTFRGFNASINEMIAGFTLTGGFHWLQNSVELPDILARSRRRSPTPTVRPIPSGGAQAPFNGSFSARQPLRF